MSQQDEARTTDGIDAITRLAFSIHGNPGVYALLLGSGLSRAAGIPTGWEITLDLVRCVAKLEEEADQPDCGEADQTCWITWYKRKFRKEPNYSDLIGQLAPCPDERRAILDRYIEPGEEDQQNDRKVPTKAHKAIADLVHDGFIRVIITTNFDRLLEKALSARGIEPTVVDSVHAIQGAEPLVHNRCYLVKLHGDYRDNRILNTDKELSHYPTKFNKLLARIFDEYGLVVCGWSGKWDEALRQAIIRNLSRRYSFFWAQRGEISDSKNSIANKIVQHRKGSGIPIVDANDFFTKLRDRVQTLAQTRRQDPANLDLLVNMTKRFAAKPEYRIELNDLLDSEVQRLLNRLSNDTPKVDNNSQIDNDSRDLKNSKNFKKLVEFYELSTETLGCMFGVLGRWGDSTAHDTVVNAIFHLLSQLGAMQQVCSDNEQEPFLGVLKHLRYYPAVLLVWAYGIGLTVPKPKRLKDLHNLLSQTVRSEDISDNSIGLNDKRLTTFIVAKWVHHFGNFDRTWQRLPHVQSSRTPFSDHLLTILDKWRKNFAPVLADFNDLYDNWEILLALTYCEETDDDNDIRSHRQDKIKFLSFSHRAWRRDHQSPERIRRQITNYAFRQELIQAGFADGNRDGLDRIINRYKQHMLRTHDPSLFC